MNQPTFRFARIFAIFWAIAMSLCLSFAAPLQAADKFEPVKLQSLRGAEIDASDPEGDGTRFGRDTAPLPRDFVQQPPLIPHTTKGYIVSKSFNKCLDCHAWSRAKESGATRISVTHFKTRDGIELSSVSPNRFFCTQCHVPQSDAKPLVDNGYQRAQGLR
jgi:cytochrome c-type protein NapB